MHFKEVTPSSPSKQASKQATGQANTHKYWQLHKIEQMKTAPGAQTKFLGHQTDGGGKRAHVPFYDIEIL